MRLIDGGRTFSSCASSPTLTGPLRSIVASADNCEWVMPCDACCRRRRASRNVARRSRVISEGALMDPYADPDSAPNQADEPTDEFLGRWSSYFCSARTREPAYG